MSHTQSGHDRKSGTIAEMERIWSLLPSSLRERFDRFRSSESSKSYALRLDQSTHSSFKQMSAKARQINDD